MKKITVIFIILCIILAAILLVTAGRMEAEKRSLKEQVSKLQAYIAELEDKNADLASEVKVLNDENIRIEEQIKNFEEENSMLKHLIENRQKAYRKEVLYNLADIQELDPDILVDLRYASEENFMNRQVYPENSRALLRRETAVKLVQANELFKKDGYTIKIWDAYRPLSVQKIMWENSPLPGYIAPPDSGSKHNRGAAVDMTLVDQEGRELEMPTGFDDFTEKAARNYPHHSAAARKNMDYMTQIMVNCGFKGIRTEWWHFEDVNANDFPVLDIDLNFSDE